MKKTLQSLLGRTYALDGSDRNLTITDNTVSGYSPERNVAKIEVQNGKLMVNLFRGYWYKPGDFVEMDSIEDIANAIKNRFKSRGNNGKVI